LQKFFSRIEMYKYKSVHLYATCTWVVGMHKCWLLCRYVLFLLSITVLTLPICEADVFLYVCNHHNVTVILLSDHCNIFTWNLQGMDCAPCFPPQILQGCFLCSVLSNSPSQRYVVQQGDSIEVTVMKMHLFGGTKLTQFSQ